MSATHVGRIIVALLTAYMAVYFSPPDSADVLPTTRYVAPTGVNWGDCTSPSSPCQTIQYAVNQAISGDTILVAGGIYTYKPADDNPLCRFLRTPAVVCFVDKRLIIQGGYSTTNWGEPNPGQNPTIIDGNNAYRGVAVVGYATTDTHLEMRGVTIRNCNVQGPTYSDGSDLLGLGGGMLALHSSVTLRNVIFRGNKVRGASVSAGIGGAAYGAALHIYKPSPGAVSLLSGVVFESNESYGGTGVDRGGVAFGALSVDNANAIIEDSTFVNNVAQAGNATGSGRGGNPPEADGLGGGIGVQDSNVILRRVTMLNNRAVGGNAQQYGGGAYGGGIFIEDLSENTPTVQVHISDSYFAGNMAIGGNGAGEGGFAVGGGICAANSQLTIERTSVISNSATGGSGGKAGRGVGGGIYTSALRANTGASTNIWNTVVAENFANKGNGSEGLDSGGGGIVIHGMNAEITHVTLAQNRLGPALFLGQALLVLPWSSQSLLLPATVTVKQTVVANHTTGTSGATAVVVQENSALTFESGLFAGNNRNINTDRVPVPPGTINGLSTMINVSSAGFISPGSPHSNYHLRLDSAAKDRSQQTVIGDDIDRESRPYGNGSDFGADEYHPFPLTVVPGDGTLYLDWETGAKILTGGLGHYEISVSCEEGANPPKEVGCGEVLNVGAGTELKLTGVTNFKRYTVEVIAYDNSEVLIATSIRVSVFPTNLFVFLPLVLR